MKIYCEKCQKEITQEVDKRFEGFEIGRLICPHCHAVQRRYLSEADMQIYFAISASFYGFMALAISLILQYAGVNVLSFVVIAIIFVGAYKFQKSLSRRQYTKPFFKEDNMYFNFEEDKTTTGKRLRWQFMAFIVIALMIGSNPEYLLPYCLMIVAFVVVVYVKIRIILKNEQQIVDEKRK